MDPQRKSHKPIGKNKVWHYTVLISHSVTRDIHTRPSSNHNRQSQDRELDHYRVSPWVVCTLPERAFVRLDASQIDSSVSSEVNSLASSALPYRRSPPSWLKTTPEDVVEHIIKLARKGLTPSQIGVALRDSHGIPQVRFVTGNKILRILKSNGASATSS